MHETKCLGIDPGLANTGYAVVSQNASGKFCVFSHGCIKTKKASPNGEGCRYLAIYQKLSEVIASHSPTCVAVERVFYNQNVSSAITTGGVIAICLLAAEEAGIANLQIKPQAAKQAIGFGTADKAKVKQMVQKLTGVSIRDSHAADAVAVAIAGILYERRKRKHLTDDLLHSSEANQAHQNRVHP